MINAFINPLKQFMKNETNKFKDTKKKLKILQTEYDSN